MKLVKNRKFLIAILVLTIGGITSIFFGSSSVDDDIFVEVSKSDLNIEIVTSGELEAKNSEKILGPKSMRTIGVWNVKITDLIDEGTYVKQGDYIASLDRSEVANKLKDLSAQVEKSLSQFIAAKLDTALSLREARDQLINLKYSFEEKEIVLKQSKYESPSIIRQAEIELEKSKRSYDQSKENYQLKYKQAKAKVAEKAAELKSQEIKYERAKEVIEEFTINAPKDGMLVYYRSWDGTKVQVGSQISGWDPVVATLPDLSQMVSKTFVNEIDISKIEKNQFVKIGVDAFPDKKYTGKIVSVANVGEQLPNSDAKVFEVVIEINEGDSILKPSMTTSNKIIASEYEEVLNIPIESVLNTDSISFVFVKDGLSITRKEIKKGASNDNSIIVKEGLKEGDKILLNRPENPDDYPLIRL